MANLFDVRLSGQQGRMVDQEIGDQMLGQGGGKSLLTHPGFTSSSAAALPSLAGTPMPGQGGGKSLLTHPGFTSSSAVALPSLADATFVRRPPDAGHKEMQGSLEPFGCHLQSPTATCDAWLEAFEAVGACQPGAQSSTAETTKILQQAHVVVAGAINMAQTHRPVLRVDVRPNQKRMPEWMQMEEELGGREHLPWYDKANEIPPVDDFPIWPMGASDVALETVLEATHTDTNLGKEVAPQRSAMVLPKTKSRLHPCRHSERLEHHKSMQSQLKATRVFEMEHAPPTIKQFLQRLGQMEIQAAEREAPPCVDQPREDEPRSQLRFEEQRFSAGARSSNVALDAVLEATDEVTNTGEDEAPQRAQVVLPKPKVRLNNRRRRAQWLRKQREMSTEVGEMQPADYPTSTTQQGSEVEAQESCGPSSSSNESPCTIGLGGTGSFPAEFWSVVDSLQIPISL